MGGYLRWPLRLRYAFRATRALFLPASIIPFLIGAFYSFKIERALPLPELALGLTGIGGIHLAGNLFNDYFDYKNGADNMAGEKSPFFGGSRVIQEGLLKDTDILGEALFFLAVSVLSVIGLYAVTKNIVFLLLMAGAGFLAFEYTAPPLRLAYRMLGELDIFLLFGVFLVMGSFYLFTGSVDTGAFAISLPIAFLVSAIIVCNEVPDYRSDASAGKRNLISLVGPERGYILYSSCVFLSAAALARNILYGNLPPAAGAILLVYMLAVEPAAILKKLPADTNRYVRASSLTIKLHAFTGMAMIFFLLIKR